MFEYQHRWADEVGPYAEDMCGYRSSLDLEGLVEDGVVAFHAHSLERWLVTLRARNRVAPNVPSTSLHHTLSYPNAWGQVLQISSGMTNGRDALVCSSRAALEGFRGMCESLKYRMGFPMRCPELAMIPLPIDTERYKIRDKQAARDLLGWDGTAKVVLWVGRFSVTDKADLLPLLRAFRAMGDRRDRPLLVLARFGNAEYVDLLREICVAMDITDRVHLRLNPPMENIPWYYAGCDIFVAPTDNVQETFGLVVAEAAASGRPVVAADWDGYRESVVNGETGLLIGTVGASMPGRVGRTLGVSGWRTDHLICGQGVALDWQELQGALERLLDAPALCGRMGEAGRAYASERMGFRRVMSQTEDLWRALWERPVLTDVRDICAPDYEMLVRIYATRVIEEADVVSLGPADLAIDFLYYYLPEMEHVVSKREANEVLRFVEESGPGVEVWRIARWAWDSGFEDPRLAIVWLYKHGYLSVATRA